MMYTLIFVVLLAILFAIYYKRRIPMPVYKLGGEASKSIGDFLRTASIGEIEKTLLNKLKKTTICPIVIAKGSTSAIFIPEIQPEYKINGKPCRVAVKSSTRQDQIFHMKVIDSILFIAGYANLTIEAIILLLMGDLTNPHLPKILDYGACEMNGVSRIVFPLYGIEEIELDLTARVFPETQFWKMSPKNKIKTRLANLRELFVYTYYTGDGTYATLPNGHVLDVVEFYDDCCVKYLKTYTVLKSNGFCSFDMHPGNVFLEWSDGPPNVIFGDVGGFMVQVRPDLIILGSSTDIEQQAKYAKERMERNNGFEFIYKSFSLLTPAQQARSRAGKIFLIQPYCNYPSREVFFAEPEKKYLSSLKTAEELLSYF